MKQFFTILLFLLGITCQAQVVRWVLHPKYDNIKMLGTGYYVVSNNGKYGMADSNEKECIPLEYDSIAPFASHQALLFKNNKFTAYVSDRGKLTNAENYELTGISVFADGYLLVHDGKGYHFISADTGNPIGPYPDASPFCEGYARVKIQQGKERICQYLSAETGQPVSLPLGDYSTDDIDFMSSSNNGKSIVVIKKRVYEYDFKNNSLITMSTDGSDARKSRVVTNERPVFLMTNEDGNYILQLKQGYMTFDHLMRLISIQYTDMDEQKFTVPQPVPMSPTSPLTGAKFNDSNLLGLMLGSKVILPAQFESIPMLWDNEAIVVKNGKRGVIRVDENARKWHYLLNGNNDISFEHKSVKTEIKVVCPTSMEHQKLSLKSEDKNFLINKDTRKGDTNVETTSLDYECTLLLPKNITTKPTPSSVSVSLTYDGITFPTEKIEFNNWFINNYIVEIDKPQFSGGTMTIDVYVKNNARDKNFYKDVTIEATDSVIATINPVNEETYTAKFVNWKNNRIVFEVRVKEDGCPTLPYSFTVPTKEGALEKQSKPSEGEAPEPKKVVKKPKTTPKKEKENIFF